MLDERLLKILACPVCVTDESVKNASVDLKDSKLVCRNCGRRYAIVDGIPNMIPEEAELPEKDEQ